MIRSISPRTPRATLGATWGAVLGAILLAGCTTGADIKALQESPGFQVGYNDGCLTSTEDGKSFSSKQSRDSYAFENDDAYRAGWRQGYAQCSSSSSIPDSNNGGRLLGEREDY